MRKSGGVHKVKILLLFLIVLALFLLGVVAVLVVMIFNLKKGKNEMIVKKYQVLQMDNSEEKVKFVGSGTSFENIETDDFLSFRNEDNMLTSMIVSNFGKREYECEGSCICTERRSSSVMKNGVRVLVAAVSSFLAYNVAKNELRKDCLNMYNSDDEYSCHSGHLEVEVEECVALLFDLGVPSRFDEMDKPDYANAKSADEEYQPGMYKCQGHCVPSGFLRNNKEVYEMCQELFLDGMIKADSVHEARIIFMEDTLCLYCPENSRWDKRYGTSYHMYCVGKYDNINESVTCKRILESSENG